MKRPSDQEFHEEIDTLDKQQRYALAMLKATREADRARAEEARLTEEAKRKDATIKALADGLWRSGWVVHGEWHSSRCPQSLPPAAAPCTCENQRTALRLCGRLP